MKNNIIYKRIVCIVLMVMLLVFTTRTYAANDSFKTTLSADNSSKKRGENVTITIGIKDIAIESGEKGIGAYTAKVDFDTSIFEYVSASGTDKWETPLYQSGLITGMTVDGEVTSEAQSIGSLKFKVKDNAQLGKTTIKLTKFSGSTAETDVDAQDTSISITITDENGNTSNDDNGNNQNGENGNGDNQKDPDNSKDQNDSNNPNGENERQKGKGANR